MKSVSSAQAPGRMMASRGCQRVAGRPINIGLVNNMPDPALQSTERQVARLLASATRGLDVRLHLFHMPEIERGHAAKTELLAHYMPADELPGVEIDALVVTGCEPRQSELSTEPYWASLTSLVDWASKNTISTIWSCLAVHAAVLHLDGIERRLQASKVSGVYRFARVSDHPLLAGMERAIHVPHSRYYGLYESDLVDHGYEIMTRSDEAGVDAFIKQCPSLFVFLQGHPEYDSDSLHREYRRDMGRFLSREQSTCPSLPQGYFGPAATQALTEFAHLAVTEREAELFRIFPRVKIVSPREAPWPAPAAQFFANWLDYIAQGKHRLAGVARLSAGQNVARRPRVAAVKNA
jgi:homoserine O-succinyltransferase